MKETPTNKNNKKDLVDGALQLWCRWVMVWAGSVMELLQAVLSKVSSLSGITDAVQAEHILLQLQMCLSINDAVTDVPATPAPARRRWGSFWISVWMQ